MTDLEHSDVIRRFGLCSLLEKRAESDIIKQ